MTIRFDNQTIIITGAAGGIGSEYATLLASRGAQVVVNEIPAAAEAAARLVATIQAAGGSAVVDTHDIATAEGGEALIEHAVERFGSVEGVIHNAGILRDRTLSRMSLADVEEVMAVHLMGGFHVVLPAFRLMKDASYGRILLTTSGSGLAGTFGQANYGAAKAGLVGLMHVAAIEGRRHGILANALAPGARTQMTENLLGDLEARLDPALVAPMAAYLVSSACESTHEIYTAAGGRFARYFVGTAQGWYGGSSEVPSLEAIDANIEGIRSLDEFRVLDQGGDEGDLLREAYVRAGESIE